MLLGVFTYADWFVLGLGLDIAGAVMLAWSFIVQSPDSIAREILLPMRTFEGLARGMREFAHSLARQRAEARLGGALLVLGFAVQSAAYLFTDGSAHFTSWEQRAVVVALVLVVWAPVIALWRFWVPASAKRTFDAAYEAQEADVAARVAAGD
jgi:peptidoglycan/LPS O-acetylase OafA/YrhL